MADKKEIRLASINDNFCVYMHTCPNGKVYIGQTNQKPIHRWGEYGNGYIRHQYFYKAIQKYGWENIRHEIIYSGLTAEQANEAEKLLIAKYKSTTPEYGYNQTVGGVGGNLGYRHTDKAKQSMSEKRKGVSFSEEHCNKISSAMKGNKKGKKYGAEHPAAKTVMCIDTQKVYDTINDAAASIGVTRRAIGQAIKRNTKSGGFKWCFMEA